MLSAPWLTSLGKDAEQIVDIYKDGHHISLFIKWEPNHHQYKRHLAGVGLTGVAPGSWITPA